MTAEQPYDAVKAPSDPPNRYVPVVEGEPAQEAELVAGIKKVEEAPLVSAPMEPSAGPYRKLNEARCDGVSTGLSALGLTVKVPCGVKMPLFTVPPLHEVSTTTRNSSGRAGR